MEKRKQLVYWVGSLAAFVLMAAVFVAVPNAQSEETAQSAPVDRIVIDVLSGYGDLELPPVSFFHAKHTKVMAEQGKDCTACHKKQDGKLVLLFDRTDNGAGDSAGKNIKEIYHQGCIGCHKQYQAEGIKTGPTDAQCRSCHNAQPEEAAADAAAEAMPVRMDGGFDKVLHWRHWRSKLIAVDGQKDNCAACHHVFKPETKELVYEKGKEGSCRFCHEAEPYTDPELKVEVRSLEDAVHQDCVTCHYELKAKGAEAYGPVDCAGCHSAEGRALIEQHDAEALAKAGGELPSLPMERPKAALILPDLSQYPNGELAPGTKVSAMNPVPFDHAAHEAMSKDCRTCHHKEVAACSKCHTTSGSEEGGFVSLEAAMHSLQGKQSCQGCHREKQQAKDCAGCHQLMDQAARPSDETCKTCHTALPQGIDLPLASKLDQAQKENLAGELLKARPKMGDAYAIEDIPETVKIGRISKDYEPAVFPHRKIVLKLMEPMKNDAMAAVFHAGKGLLCQSCHHNSPASLTPPSCASCHGKAFQEPGRPGLKAAYHGQCISCHKAMGIEELKKGDETLPATSCVVCHDEKK